MKIKVMLVVLLALGIGGGAGYLAALHLGGGKGTPAAEVRKPLFYRSPMNPAVTSPVPAKDPMGMDYVPVYAEGAGAPKGPAGTVAIDPVVVQDIGVRTARAERRTLSREVHAVGRVTYDEEHVARLHPKTEGWIEKMFVNKTGERVARDAILVSFFAPQLVTTQQEYLLALKNARAMEHTSFPDIRRGAQELLASTEERLRLLDVPEHQIRELEDTGVVKKAIHIHSPFDGVVVTLGARDGQYVTPQTELYTIADLSTVWVYAEVFEADLPWVREGDEAEMRLAGVPGRTFAGRIAYVYPFVQPDTRTVRVRLEYANPDRVLKPDMFADVTVHADRRVDALAVPAEAVVRSGTRDRVFVVQAPGRFEPRPVTLGLTSGGWSQVLEGLKPGDEVVTSAQFLIDSESKLREATAKMLEPKPAADAPAVDENPMDRHGTGSDGANGAATPGMSMPGMSMQGHGEAGGPTGAPEAPAAAGSTP
jgi:membrane fusion protein, copper/silver efflux system